ncbi:NAD kinase [Marinicrinis sediminis]|uniref:NAD kinase n=1 Tax=Marinicrinis sediminis TaxID=1652465 RepID=A0ABW5R6M1_9BACL
MSLNYYVLSRGDETSNSLKKAFEAMAEERHMKQDEKNPDIVISIGGDGTMLLAFHSFVEQLDRISFVGVHTGHLGFYADWKSDELETLVELMASSPQLFSHKIVEYPLLDIEITTLDGQSHTYYALNECTLRGGRSTLVAELHLNDTPFEMFRGDGMCISTPSGSTAYNKSLGGAIIHPAIETIQIAEMASINNRVFRTLGSSMLLPKHHHCDIYPKTNQPLQISVDHMQLEFEAVQTLRCKVARQKVRFARYRPFPFWNRVKEAFIGSKYDEQR